MAVDGIFLNNESRFRVVGPNYDNSKMTKEQFLKVLLATIEWQDPLQAESISDFVNNSVKLREMEVLNSFEDSVDRLKNSLKSLELFYSTSFIGKRVLYSGDETYVEGGKGELRFKLKEPASYVEVVVKNSKGDVVERKEFTDLSSGTYPVEIDNPSLPDGYYTVSVTAKNGEGRSIDVDVESYALINGIRKEKDGIYLTTSVNKIPLENVIGIGG